MTTRLSADLRVALDQCLPSILRWCGAIARRMRQFDIRLDHKRSGNDAADALTVADLTVQELIVAALRDGNPLLRQLVIDGEEAAGDLELFARAGDLILTIDPIDGTKQYRDRRGQGYSIIVTVQSLYEVEYTLVFIPEDGLQGSWLRIDDRGVRYGTDQTELPATARLDALPPVHCVGWPKSRRFFVNGFQGLRRQCLRQAATLDLEGVRSEDLDGCIFSLLARGEYGGVLASAPNVYDFPVAMHLARALGGDAIWVDSGASVHLRETYRDNALNMRRIPGVIACSHDRELLAQMRAVGLAVLAGERRPEASE